MTDKCWPRKVRRGRPWGLQNRELNLARQPRARNSLLPVLIKLVLPVRTFHVALAESLLAASGMIRNSLLTMTGCASWRSCLGYLDERRLEDFVSFLFLLAPVASGA